ncbi:MAG: NADH-quinone oxidoreductase subunit N [Chitinophagales bacterium]|nr:NADH-quinone oxidoreductase subunit N [Chitinophagales bacterium]MDW8272983.1 NADH-quinone oxidoreductase subunit N [Chitinophagales bacterium]
MNALIYTSSLGIACLLAEIFNLRRWILPAAVFGLLIIIGLTIQDWDTDQSAREAALYNMLRADGFSLSFSILLMALTVLLLLLGKTFYASEAGKISDYVVLILFILAGGLAMVSFGNVAMLFLGIEVLSVSLYIMAAANKRERRSNEAGMKYFLMGAFASGLLLLGIALLYGETGSFDVVEIRDYIASNNATPLLYAGMALILIAMLFKVGAAPFHFWAPDVYDGSPTLHTALMATVAKIAAFAAFYRLFSACFTPLLNPFGWLFSAVVALTITVGTLSALMQESFKRMMAFSGVSNAGFLMIAIATLYGKTDNAVLYYGFAYGMASITAFAVAMYVFALSGSEKFDSFNGLARSHPWLAFAMTIAMLSLAGIPPLAGFFGKYYLFSEALRNGRMFLVLVAILNSIVAVYYYLKVVYHMYFFQIPDSGRINRVPFNYVVVIILTTTATVFGGLFPSAIIGWW